MLHNIQQAFAELNITPEEKGTAIGNEWLTSKETISSVSPINGEQISSIQLTSNKQYKFVVEEAANAFKQWRIIPAPKRGEIVRQFGEVLRTKKEQLALLLCYEMGKSLQEAKGEVQEMIDICEFAVGPVKK